MAVSTSHLDALSTAIEEVARDLPGRLGVAVRFLEDAAEVVHAADELFPAASVIKLAIMGAVYRQAANGAVRLDEPVELLPEEIVDGSGVLQHLRPGLSLTLADAVELMIIVSDNTATNLVLRRIGTEAVNRTMDELGLTSTRSAGPIRQANADAPLTERSRTTPREIAVLLTRIAEGALVSREASAAMQRTLEHQVYGDMLPRFLPVTYYPDRAGLEAEPVRVAHKTGSLSGVRNDAGIVTALTTRGLRTMVVSVFTADVRDDELWTPENIGARAVAAVGRLAYDTLLRLAEET